MKTDAWEFITSNPLLVAVVVWLVLTTTVKVIETLRGAKATLGI